MDPDTTLAIIRRAIERGAYEDAARHFEALDDWMARGGFPPESWVQRRPAATSRRAA